LAAGSKVIEIWNGRANRKARPTFYPTLEAAILAGAPWLRFMCPSCQTVGEVDLRALDRHPLMVLSQPGIRKAAGLVRDAISSARQAICPLLWLLKTACTAYALQHLTAALPVASMVRPKIEPRADAGRPRRSALEIPPSILLRADEVIDKEAR